LSFYLFRNFSFIRVMISMDTMTWPHHLDTDKSEYIWHKNLHCGRRIQKLWCPRQIMSISQGRTIWVSIFNCTVRIIVSLNENSFYIKNFRYHQIGMFVSNEHPMQLFQKFYIKYFNYKTPMYEQCIKELRLNICTACE